MCSSSPPLIHPTILYLKSEADLSIRIPRISHISRVAGKMVQSAILGFPRMGVNRDLKKATEACK